MPVTASDALVSAEVGGCPSTTSSDVVLQEGDDDELEDSLWLLELLRALWGGSELDVFTESV